MDLSVNFDSNSTSSLIANSSLTQEKCTHANTHWVGKDKVVNHHHDAPFRVLRNESRFESANCASSLAWLNKHVRVIRKGNKERQVPLPESFGRVLALHQNNLALSSNNTNNNLIDRWLSCYPRAVFVFK